jgi:hypothetical protein
MCGFQQERQIAFRQAMANRLIPIYNFCSILEGNGTNERVSDRDVSEEVLKFACQEAGIEIVDFTSQCTPDGACHSFLCISLKDEPRVTDIVNQEEFQAHELRMLEHKRGIDKLKWQLKESERLEYTILCSNAEFYRTFRAKENPSEVTQ